MKKQDKLGAVVIFTLGAIAGQMTVAAVALSLWPDLTVIRTQEYNRGYSQAIAEMRNGLLGDTLAGCIIEGMEQ